MTCRLCGFQSVLGDLHHVEAYGSPCCGSDVVDAIETFESLFDCLEDFPSVGWRRFRVKDIEEENETCGDDEVNHVSIPSHGWTAVEEAVMDQ